MSHPPVAGSAQNSSRTGRGRDCSRSSARSSSTRSGCARGAAGWLLAAGAAAYFAASTQSGGLVARFSRRYLVAASALAMAALLPVLLGSSGSVVVAAVLFCLVGLAAGVRTPASSSLGLVQIPEHPGTMMAARTGATQLGYLLGAVLGGIVIAASGYRALSLVLSAGMAVSAFLVLRVRDPFER